MTISIWRYSHLLLAISSSLFILIASVTGAILAVEPISNQLKPYTVKNAGEHSLAQTITTLNNKYDEVLTLKIDDNDFVAATVITNTGKSETFYINPFTGEKIGNLIEKPKLYKFATNLHRSLFFKSTGRFIMGFMSLLLFLIATTGVILIIKRQGGITRFFSKVVKENFEQYYHITIGRLTLIPVAILALTGVYLSLEKFSLLPDDKIKHTVDYDNIKTSPKLTYNDFESFKTIPLKDLKQIDFPFSDDPEDYFQIQLSDRELLVNQYTGAILSQQKASTLAIASHWSLALHTGKQSVLWATVLLLASLSSIFFIFSGFSMTVARKRHNPLPKNKFSANDSEYIILVGSETGSTFNFASSFYKALINTGKKVFISELNSYSLYKKAKQLIIFTSTYGTGEPPVNARDFEKLTQKIKQNHPINYAVVGFGSLAYPDFCKFAIDLDYLLFTHSDFNANTALYKINNQSFEAFTTWVQRWSKSVNIPLKIDPPKPITSKQTQLFTVINKTVINKDNTFLLELQPDKKTVFQSGDLLSIKPENDTSARLYSIGRLNNNILLSIKKHEFGLCSNYLNKLKTKDTIQAAITSNTTFHFPKKTKNVIMIANGTGLAPFLGMISNKHKAKVHLFWGGRTKSSFNMYSDLVYQALGNNLLSSLNIAYSREGKQKTYVQDLINKKADTMADMLKSGAVIMICGSVIMQNDVLAVLEAITTSKLNTPLSVFMQKKQIKTDCY